MKINANDKHKAKGMQLYLKQQGLLNYSYEMLELSKLRS